MGIMSDINAILFGSYQTNRISETSNLAECIRRDDEEQWKKKAQKECKLEPVWDLLDKKVVRK